MQRANFLLIAAAIAVAPVRAAPVGGPLISVYPSSAIGGDGFAWSGVADAQGYLHFGTNGLLSFDGTSWRLDQAADSFALRGLALAPDGSILAAATGELGIFLPAGADGRWEYRSLLGSLPESDRDVGELWYAFAAANGRAAFVGANRVYWWDGKTFLIDRFPAGRRISACQSRDEIFVHQPGRGLWVLAPGRRRQAVEESALGGGVAVWIERIQSGELLIATSRGFMIAGGKSSRAIYPQASDFVRRNVLTCVRRLKNGTLAVGTLRGGLALLEPDGHLSRIENRRSGLPTDEVFSILEDGEGGLWLGSSANIVRVASGSGTWLYRDSAASGDQTVVALERGPSGVYLISDDGSITLSRDEAPEVLAPVASLGRHTYSAATSQGGLYVGGSRGIVGVSGPGAGRVLDLGRPVFALGQSADRRSLLAVADRSLLSVDPAAQRIQLLNEELPDLATTIAQSPDGTIWLGMSRTGIQRLPSGADRAHAAGAGLGSHGHGEVARSGADSLYVFAERQAWRVRARPGSTERIEPVAGFPRREVATAQGREDADGAWAVTSGEGRLGPCLIEIQGGACRTWAIEGLGRVGVPEALHVDPTPRGHIAWIAGSSGVLRAFLDPAAPAVIPPRPSLQITGVGADAFEMRANFRSYAFRPAFGLQVRIDGIDRDWSPAEPGEPRLLGALRPGQYRVRARVQSADGAAGPVAEARWEVPLRWWERAPAVAGAFACAVLLAWLAVRLRVRALQRRTVALEARIRERTAELERVTADKAKLVAGISHDIRNPLNGIVGLALALEETALGPEQRRLLDAVGAGARHLSGMLEDVIDFARLETGRAKLNEEPYSPQSMLEEVVSLLLIDAQRTGAELVVECASDLPVTAHGDGRRVRQILLNFAHNAVKYAGGRIVLRAAGAGPDRLEFRVDDQGPGIADPEQESLFEPFVRGVTPQEREGSGLGLATARRWAELMGGSVRLVTRLGEGCSFRLEVPLGRRSVAVPAPLPVIRRVLLVEDEDYSAAGTTAVAARLGIAVAARAKSGAEAMRLWEEGPFDVVLLDRQLPDLDGTEVCRMLRARAQGASPLILGVTGSPDPGTEQACLSAGMDRVLGKPVTPESLREALVQANRFRMLRFLGGGTAEGFRNEAGRYRTILAQLEEELRGAIATARPEEIRKAAHRLAGHFRMVEWNEGIAATAAIEDAAARGEAELAAPLQQIAAAGRDLVSALERAGGGLAARDENRSPGRTASAPELSSAKACAAD